MLRFLKSLGLVVVFVAVIAAGAVLYARFAPKTIREQVAEKVYTTAIDNAAMMNAEAQAKATLPQFWAAFEKDPIRFTNPNYYSIKVAMPTPTGNEEIIWASSITKKGDKITARLANDPENLPGHKIGDTIEAPPDKIYDWAIAAPGGWYGHYTTRVLLGEMTAQEATEIRKLLAAEPLPKEWAR